jgi:hypothetical protein
MSNTPLTLPSLCEDVLLLIFSFLSPTHTSSETSTPLKNLSLVSHHFHTLLTPLLFKSLHINKPISQLPPLPPSAVHHARTFKLDMFGSLWWWCSGSYTSDSDALAIFSCISMLKNLKTLDVSMMKRSTDIFTSAFGGPHDPSTFILENVERLEVSSSAAFLHSHCPHLISLTIKDDSEIEPYTPLPIRLLPLHPGFTKIPDKLTGFEAPATWTPTELASLTSLFPHLTTLRMRSDTYGYHTPLPEILSIVSTLPNLYTLYLVKAAYLGTGYAHQALLWRRRMQACNVNDRREIWKRNEEARVEVEDGVVRQAFEMCGALRVCWVGEKRVARRCAGGMSWVWSRQYDEDDVRLAGQQSCGTRYGVMGLIG